MNTIITVMKQFQLYNNKIVIHSSLQHLRHLGVGSSTIHYIRKLFIVA